MYANQIYLGHGTYGFEAASLFYFSKHASEVTLAEAATLSAQSGPVTRASAPMALFRPSICPWRSGSVAREISAGDLERVKELIASHEARLEV